jgi:hypothetical protein
MAGQGRTPQVVVQFVEQVDGPNVFEGGRHRNDWHQVTATALIRHDDDLVFLRDDEIVERWPATSVSRVEWFRGPDLSPQPLPPLSEPRRPAYTLDQKRAENPQAYRRWTPKEEEQLRQEVADGLTTPEIAQRHGRNDGAIASRALRLGLELPDRVKAIGEEPMPPH